MLKDKLKPMTSAGEKEVPVPVWVSALLNVAFIAAGGYLLTLGGTAFVIGVVLTLAGLVGLASIMEVV